MKEENKQCLKCRHFNRYYTKEVKKFKGTNFGICDKKQIEVNRFDSCDLWTQKSHHIHPRILRVYLSELLTELSEIRNIIEATRDEEL